MGEETNNVVQPGVLGECAVACFVAENPDSSTDQTLDEAIGCPGSNSQG